MRNKRSIMNFLNFLEVNISYILNYLDYVLDYIILILIVTENYIQGTNNGEDMRLMALILTTMKWI